MAMLLQYLDVDGKIVVVGAEVWIAAIIDSLTTREKEAVISKAQALDEMIQKEIEKKGREVASASPLELSAFLNGKKN